MPGGFIYWLGIFIDWFKSSIIIRTHFIIVIWSWYDMEYRFSWSFRIAELDVECCPNNIFCRSKKGKPWRSCKGGLYGRNMMFLEEAVLIAFEVYLTCICCTQENCINLVTIWRWCYLKVIFPLWCFKIDFWRNITTKYYLLFYGLFFSLLDSKWWHIILSCRNSLTC